MPPYTYDNKEVRVLRNGAKSIRRVVIRGGAGFKSVTHKKGKKHRTVTFKLNRVEIDHIKSGKFVKGLFDECNRAP